MTKFNHLVTPSLCHLVILSRPGRILAVNPRTSQLLVIRRREQAAGVASVPADDLVGLAALLAALLPICRPGRVGLGGCAFVLVPEQGHAFAVALDAHRHSRERGGAQFRGAERVALALAYTLEEVLPQHF